jgi:hypothetical protein
MPALGDGPSVASIVVTVASPPDPRGAEIEERLRELTLLMYDTSVPIPVLEERVIPYLAPDVEFVDPWLVSRGKDRFVTGLRGFHCVIRFDFDISQLSVSLDAPNGRARALVDGVMNLRQVPFYTYPLRTILVYELALTAGLQIERLEEMWSFGDMIANAPFLVGRLYRGVFRPAAGAFFAAAFRLSCALFGGRARSPG